MERVGITTDFEVASGMVKLYIKRYFDKVGIEFHDNAIASILDYKLNIDAREEDDNLKITATFSVDTKTEGTMPDDLESIGLKIANQYVDFIEFCEALKRKRDDQKH